MKLDLDKLQKDLDEIPAKGSGGRKCGLQELVLEHPEAEAIIREALTSDKYSAMRVADTLTKNGLKIGESTITKHRRGLCTRCQGGK